jgi:hypothetical protein
VEYANDFIQRDAERIEEINKTLREVHLSMKDVEARATLLTMDKPERIGHLMSKLNARRNALLGEIERRQKAFAASLRQAADAVDGDFKEIEPRRPRQAESNEQ